ncbi:MAG: ABC-F family ATP-binding cassette domain-containing protein [Lachnospiraceae bacterium]|nr:ABC-F family ATP-binding cassette domain-containing protein [Lachnospiraceae bacterium]
MNIITVDEITKAYGERKIFDRASFFLQEGEKAGVLGINGTGKSTLLKMIVGEDEPDMGTIIRAKGKVIAYLPQNPVFRDEDTLMDAVLRESGHKESDAKAMLTRLGVADFGQSCGRLSGGERKRLALVKTLLAPADILVLDEPTNHLDQEMADWLEDTLKKFKGSIIMITHDRYFLDSVCNRIIEVDKGKIYSYEANYEGYLSLKAEREEMAAASDRKRHSILRTELEWVKRGARARSTKQKARLERFEQLSRMTDAAKDGTVELGSVKSRLGRTTVELHDVSKAYGDKVLIRDFTYLFLRNDRVGFMGHNGCGKSTLMKMIMGEVMPDEGRIEIGQTVKIGYFAQEIKDDEMPSEQKVIDYIRDVAEYVETDDGKISAARLLEKFLFAGEDQYGPVGKLSGGQRRRLYLCKVLMGAPNVLILDEPTNDLDITTLTILEDYLDSFPGIVIVVSHDRYFLDRVVGRMFIFEGNGKLRQSEGGYTDYQNRLLTEKQLANDNSNSGSGQTGSRDGSPEEAETGLSGSSGKAKWNTGRVKKLKFTYQEQRDYETIEADIAALEEKIEQADANMLKFARDFVKLKELTEEKEKAETALEEKMERWMYLEELAEKIKDQ